MKWLTKASAPFSVFSLAAAGTSDVSVGDGLPDPDALGEALLTVPDGVGAVVGGVSSDWHPPSTTAAPNATVAATDGPANRILIERCVMASLSRPPLVGPAPKR